MGDRLVAYEEDLRRAWGSEVPAVPVLKVDYRNPDRTYYVLIGGNILTPPEEEPIPDEVPPAQRAGYEQGRDRARSQNNLKQLVLIMKMFAGENRGHLPGGWLTVFPEYLTDPLICTTPWDEPFTNSYQLLFPGATEEQLEPLGTQAEVPTIIEKRGNPKQIDPRGRNVAFLDGHVEFVKDTEWEAKVGRFLR